MLAQVPKPVKNVVIFSLVPSVVRLYGLYPVTDRLGEYVYLRQVTFKKVGLGMSEFQTKVVIHLEDLPNAPDQIVEGRSQIMNNVSNCEANRWRRLATHVEYIREKGVLPFTLYANEYFTWFGRKEAVDQYFQAVDATTCPVKPELSKFHIIMP
jgi:hypothetical protein